MIEGASDLPVADVAPSRLFRLPWNAADNAMPWLETLLRLRRCDAKMIAGEAVPALASFTRLRLRLFPDPQLPTAIHRYRFSHGSGH
jgi:hypothetical protein